MNTIPKAISIAYDLEINNYMMTRYINRLKYEINQLGFKHYNRSAPTKGKSNISIGSIIFVGGVIGAVIGVIIGIIVGLAQADAWWEYIFDPIGEAFYYALIIGGCGLGLGIVAGIITNARENQKLESDYQEECRTHEKRMKEDSARIQRELKQKKVLLSQLEHMKTRQAESTRLLNQVYQHIRLDEKYRNIVPIGYMNEFIRLNISTHLEGTDGLYYLVRQELRWDQMQYTLNDISSKLDTIIDQNHALYSELKGINRKCESLLSETQKNVELAIKNNKQLSTISETNAIIAYNTDRIRKENSYQSFLMTTQFL